jgi:thiamine biosynthesis lipoprotein
MDEFLQRFPFRAMDSPCELQLYGASAPVVAEAVIAEIALFEAKYTRYRSSSLLSRINASAGDRRGIRVDDETASLLDYAETAFRESEGFFDITSGVLREVWDFRSGRVPSRAEVSRVLRHVGWRKLSWQRPLLVMPNGMQLDFGGFGKEYAADRAAELCRQHGIRCGLVDLGGDVSIVGPHPSGLGWRVGVRDPRQPEQALGCVPLNRGGIATSGDYQRFMEVDGCRYSHLLDPRTGWPVRGLASVSVVASHCLVAGTASTIAMLKGQGGARWLDESKLPNLRVDAQGRISGSLWRDSMESRAAPAGAMEAMEGKEGKRAKKRKRKKGRTERMAARSRAPARPEEPPPAA